MNKRRLIAYGLFLLISIIWGVAGPVIKFTLSEIPPLIFLTYRFFLSTVIALIFFSFTKPRIPTKSRDQIMVVLNGILTVPLGLGLLFFAYEKTSSLTATVLTSIAPIAVIIAGAFFLKDRITKMEKIGVTVALVGTLFIIFEPLINGQKVAAGSFDGNLLILAHILVDTAAAILAKLALRDRTEPFALAQISFVLGFLFIAPLTLYLFPLNTILDEIRTASFTAHLGVWYMALISGSLAYGIRNLGLKSIELSETAVFTYLMPIWAAPLSLLWLGEKVTGPFILGAAIVAAGVIISEYKRRTKPAYFSGRRRKPLPLPKKRRK